MSLGYIETPLFFRSYIPASAAVSAVAVATSIIVIILVIIILIPWILKEVEQRKRYDTFFFIFFFIAFGLKNNCVPVKYCFDIQDYLFLFNASNILTTTTTYYLLYLEKLRGS